MAPLVPVSHREQVRRLLELGFEGPISGGRHEFMIRGTCRLVLPNPHRGAIGKALLARVLRQAGIDREEWESS